MMVEIKNGNPSTVSTKDLLRGLEIGFTSVFFEMDAVPELINRGEREAMIAIYATTKRKFAKFCIKKLVINAKQ
jgi:hypothetical protein